MRQAKNRYNRAGRGGAVRGPVLYIYTLSPDEFRVFEYRTLFTCDDGYTGLWAISGQVYDYDYILN